MSCGGQQCTRSLPKKSLYCRCGVGFCSKTCFISAWHLEHSKVCTFSEEITAAVEQKRNPNKSGATLLVSVALSRHKPVHAPFATLTLEVGPQDTHLDGGHGDSPQSCPSTPADSLPPEVVAYRRSRSQEFGDAAMQASLASSSCGTQRYKLADFMNVGEPIGNGSFGHVLKVVHRETAEFFAMKVIPKKKILEHQMTKYLAREVKTQMLMQHPNILPMHYYFEDASKVYLLLEYASGGSLFSLLRKRKYLLESEAAPLFFDIAKALNYLHNNGIIHRDLKPENVLMCTGKAKLADFGWCQELCKDCSRNTFCGTWDYLPPEMVNKEPHDCTIDIWALGVLLYEMLIGRPPFTAFSQTKIMEKITNVEYLIPEMISDLASTLIAKLLVKEKTERLKVSKALRHPWVRLFVVDAEGASSEDEVAVPSSPTGTDTTALTESTFSKCLDVVDVSQTMPVVVCDASAKVQDQDILRATEMQTPACVTPLGQLMASPAGGGMLATTTCLAKASDADFDDCGNNDLNSTRLCTPTDHVSLRPLGGFLELGETIEEVVRRKMAVVRRNVGLGEDEMLASPPMGAKPQSDVTALLPRSVASMNKHVHEVTSDSTTPTLPVTEDESSQTSAKSPASLDHTERLVHLRSFRGQLTSMRTQINKDLDDMSRMLSQEFDSDSKSSCVTFSGESPKERLFCQDVGDIGKSASKVPENVSEGQYRVSLDLLMQKIEDAVLSRRSTV